MLSLFILVLFGVGVAFFATQNSQVTSVVLGPYSLANIPLYMVVIGAILFGILVSWIVSLFGFISTSMTLRSKDGRIRSTESRIRQLENENAALRDELDDNEHHVPIQTEETHHTNPFVRFRQRFS
jgi:uncharacterized integral membrane protein